MKLEIPIQTPRLILRSLEESDANARYVAWMNDPDVVRFLEARLSQHDAVSLRTFIETNNERLDSLLLGIFLEAGQHIGNIKLGPIDTYHQHAAVGILIGEREWWGHGIASESIVGLTTYAFDVMGLERLYAGCYAANEGSRRAFLRAGWFEEGRGKDHWRTDAGREDDLRLGISKRSWRRPAT